MQESWLNLNGLYLHYYDWPGDAPALLCLHGITANARQWDALAERLDGRHRLIAPDMRGRGLSDKPPAGSYGFARHAADAAALLRALDTGPVVVVGHSFGAYIAVQLATDYPELVSHVMLIDGGGLEDLDEAALLAQLAPSFKRLEVVFPSFDACLGYWQQIPFLQPWSEYLDRYIAADVDTSDDGAVTARMSRAALEDDVAAVIGQPRDEWKARLGSLRAPASVLWAPVGLLDPAQPLFSRASAAALVAALPAALPAARLVPIDGANHYTVVFSPDGVAQVVGALGELVARGAASAEAEWADAASRWAASRWAEPPGAQAPG